MNCRYGLILVVLLSSLPLPLQAADWPQFMHNPQRTGDAADEPLQLPLQLAAQVKLDDAVLSSPAVVAGRAYVVDQMGAAYCIDPEARRIVWKAAPDAANAMGSNTSSPCVIDGRVYYGTTAGKFHILRADDGSVIRSIDFGWPITASPAFDGGRIYFQTVEGVVHCLNPQGESIWKWDHFAQYTDPSEKEFASRWPGSYNAPHYGGNEVAIRDKQLVTGIGWDHFCLKDDGDKPKLLWCNRAALGKDDGIPMAPSIAGDYVYTAWPGVDAAGCLLRVRLADGKFERKPDQLGRDYWAILGTPAVRGATVYFGRTIRGVTAYEFEKGTQWESFRWSQPKGFTPVISSPVLTKDHCVFTTITGELIAVPLSARGADLENLKPEPFRFQTPHGKFISSTPAVSGGRVYFGCDDGYFYVLSPGGQQQPRKEKLTVHQRRAKPQPASPARYGWPSPFGGPHNNSFVDDAQLQPPLQMRWAVRSFAMFKQQMSATGDDLVFQSMAGTVACIEQATGRLRWRTRVAPAGGGETVGYSGVLCTGGKVVLHVPSHRESEIVCLDQQSGEVLWRKPTGQTRGSTARAAPVAAANRIVFGYTAPQPDDEKTKAAVVEAWNADTGEVAWQVKMNTRGNTLRPNGAADGDVVFFTSAFRGSRGEVQGETLAIDAASGQVKWRAKDVYGGGESSAIPVVHDGKLYIVGKDALYCLNCKTGELAWKEQRRGLWFHGICIGDGYYTCRGYSGFAERYRLSDRKPERRDGKQILLGAEAHACGPVVLTSGDISIAISIVGLHVRDTNTGELLWQSKGFAPRTCASAIPASGRIFCNPQVNGMLYCFEPAKR